MTKCTVERAFELARTGHYRTVTEIRGALKAERLEAVEPSLAGPSIRAQLKAAIRQARTAEAGAT